MQLWDRLWPCTVAVRAVQTELYLGLRVSQCLEQMLEGMGKATPSSLLLCPGQCPAVLGHQGLGLHPSLVPQQCCPTPPSSRVLWLYIPPVLAVSTTQPPALC